MIDLLTPKESISYLFYLNFNKRNYLVISKLQKSLIFNIYMYQ